MTLVPFASLALSSAIAMLAAPSAHADAAASLPTTILMAQAATPGASSAPSSTPPTRAARPAVKIGVDGVLVELETLPDAPEADRIFSLRATPTLQWQPARSWELAANVQLSATDQSGGPAAFGDTRAELGNTYIRYRSGDTRLTLGAQTIIWGRVDEIPLIDRVSRADLTRFVIDDLADRRLAQPALRWEQTMGDLKLDVVGLAGFQGAALPDPRSVWSPVNQFTGEVIGLPADPARAAFVQAARLRQDDGSRGGAAVRLTHTGDAFDLGLTVARTRQALPYYRADPAAFTLTAIHPYVRFVGVDAALAVGSITWRTELGWTGDAPFTSTAGAMVERDVLEWVGAMEFFPGDSDTRVNVQLAARRVQGSQPLLERRSYAAINGEVETPLDRGRWKAALRFNVGLNVHDVYLAPRLSFMGWEPNELYLAVHHFDGTERTIGGFHRRHGTLALGLKTRF